MVQDRHYIKDLKNLERITQTINSIETSEELLDYIRETFDLNKSWQSRNLKTGEFEFIVLNDVNFDLELNTYEGWIMDNRSGAKVYLLDYERINELFKYYA